MLGSLSEFVPDLFSNTHQSQRRTPENHQRTKPTPASQQVVRKQQFWEEGRSKNVDITAINYTNRAKPPLPKSSLPPDQIISLAKIEIAQTFSQAVSSQKAKSKKSFQQYQPSDKSLLLQNYHRLKNGGEMQEKQLLQLRRMQYQLQNPAEVPAHKSSFFHLKGKLKHNHHLLKSLVRVEEEEMVSQKTAFQISFENMSNKFEQIRVENKLRKMDQVVQQLANPKPLFLSKRQLEVKTDALAIGRSKSLNSSTRQLNLKIVQQNTKRWIKLRSKSVESQQQKAESQSNSIKSAELRLTEHNRKKVMAAISKLVNRKTMHKHNSLPVRKYSQHITALRKSSYISCT